MAQWNTLHIFSYGESQAIGEDYNKKAQTINLTAAQPVIDNIYSKKPIDNDASPEYRVITIFNDFEGRYDPQTGDNFTVPYSELDSALCQALVDEIYLSN